MRIWPADGSYNFLHLPLDMRNNRCSGCAFINLISRAAAFQFYSRWNGNRLPGMTHQGRPLTVRRSKAQGMIEVLDQCKRKRVGRLQNPKHIPIFFVNGEIVSYHDAIAHYASSLAE